MRTIYTIFRVALGRVATCTTFFRATACDAMHGIAVAILSVHLSVRQMRVL